MKKKTVAFFNLKKEKHPVFGMGYRYRFTKEDWVKDAIALDYTFKKIELWAKNMQELLQKEETL